MKVGDVDNESKKAGAMGSLPGTQMEGPKEEPRTLSLAGWNVAVMLGSAGKKGDHGQKLRPTRPSHHEDGLEIQGHPCDGGPWISGGTGDELLRLAESVGVEKGTF